MARTNGRMTSITPWLVGGIIGAGMAFMFAPQSGKRTRRDLRKFGERMGRDVRNSLADVTESVQDGMGRSLNWTLKTTKTAVGSGLRELNKIRRAS